MFKVRGLILSFICVLCVPGFVSAVEQQQSAGLSRQMKRLHEYERLQRVLEESNPDLLQQFVPLSEKSMTRAKLAAQDKKAIGAFLDKVEADLNLNQQDKKAIAQFLKSGLSTGAKVGIGLGSAAAVIAALAGLAIAARNGVSFGIKSALAGFTPLPTGGASWVGAGVDTGAGRMPTAGDRVSPVIGATLGTEDSVSARTAADGGGLAGAGGVIARAGRGRSSSLTNNILGGKSAMKGRASSVDNMLPVSPATGVPSGPRVAAGADDDGSAGARLDEGGLARAGGSLVAPAAPSATVFARGDIEAGAGAAAGVVGGAATGAEDSVGEVSVPARAAADEGGFAGAGGPLVVPAAPSATVVLSSDIKAGAGRGADEVGVVTRATAGVGAGVFGIAGEGTVAGAGKFVSSGCKANIFLLDEEVQGLSLPLNYGEFKLLALKYPFDGRNDCYNHAQYGPLVIQKQAGFLLIFVTKQNTLGIYPIGRVDDENNIKYFRKSVDDYIIKEYLNGGKS
jgi:hypothetical protein